MSCSHPIVINGRICSCGKCINCRKRRISDWAVRLQLESRSYKHNCSFITLTYNNENCPSDYTLRKRDYQLFLKRLRKRLDKLNIKIRYFICGEYGEKFGRPHYHLIVFGLPVGMVQLVDKAWNKGFIKMLNVGFKQCRYVAKYCVKQFAKERVNADGEVISEFVEMSRRPGISKDFFYSKCYSMLL